MDNFAGTGLRKNNATLGTPGFVERVNFKENIGFYVPQKSQHVKIPTTKGTIHYSKSGIHIVPSDPKG